MTKKSLEIVITAHTEGELLMRSFKSAQMNAALLADTGVCPSISIYLDFADELTLEVAQGLISEVSLHEVAFADLALTRNRAVADSNADFLAFLDADDLWCEDWLAKALRFLEKQNSENVVLHPEINYYFGTKSARAKLVTKSPSSVEPGFSSFSIASRNLWSALSLAPIGVFRRVPYRQKDRTLGVGFEDWSFNIECLAAGFSHVVVPETVHFLRDKPKADSLGKQSAGQGLTFFPSQLWSKGESV